MAKYNQYAPQSVSHPGETLKEKLIEMGLSQKTFAVLVHQSEQDIAKVINGESSITPDMAMEFTNILKIPSHFWLNRQQNYDLAMGIVFLHDINSPHSAADNAPLVAHAHYQISPLV